MTEIDNTTTQILRDAPEVISTYLGAHTSRDVDTAIRTFTPDAAVTDEGNTYRGRNEIRNWLASAGSEYTFTTVFTGVTRDGSDVDVTARLEGDFPGGVADLHYRFTLAGASISRLVIEP